MHRRPPETRSPASAGLPRRRTPTEFTASSILLALLCGIVAGIASYFASYAKVRGELRAATEDMRQSLANLSTATRTVETEKAKVAADALLESERRKTVYALAIATQSLIHSMCRLAWDAGARREVRKTAGELCNAEAHKLLPELFSQLAVLRLVDPSSRPGIQARITGLFDGETLAVERSAAELTVVAQRP